MTSSEAAQGGERELVLGIEDKLTTSGGPRRIPREDVAELCVQCLGMPEAINRYESTLPAAIHLAAPLVVLTLVSSAC